MTALRRAALDYAAAGYEVFPLRGKLPHGNCPECDPRSPRHQPHRAADCAHELCHGLYAATTDPERVERFWRRWPQANIGARVPKSLLVLDVDPRSGGDHSLAALEAANLRLPLTRTSHSGRGDGGHHRWFLHPGGKPSAARLGAGLDVKTHAGYVVLPPSRHPDTGRPYWWAEPLGECAQVPVWLKRLMLPPLAAPTAAARTRHKIDGASVADAYSAAATWREILGPHGWSSPDQDPDRDGARWRHPGASHPVSASIRHGCLFVYSTGTPFEATEPEAPHGYTKFRAYAVLEHRGDLRAAALALREAS